MRNLCIKGGCVKILYLALVAIIALLSIAAGAAKIMESPQETQFLQTFGFNSVLIITYGLVQVVGGVLIAIPKTVKWGSVVTLSAFALSTILIVLSGNYIFALISLLPILISLFIFRQASKITHNN